MKYNVIKLRTNGTAKIYPPLKTDFDYQIISNDTCPPFWKYNKIKINLLNFRNESFGPNMKVISLVGVGIDISVAVGILIFFFRDYNLPTLFNDILGPWSLCGFQIGSLRCSGFGKTKFIVTMIYRFGSPLVDSLLGKNKR